MTRVNTRNLFESTAKCRYNAVQFIMILHTALRWLQRNLNQILSHNRHPIARPHGRAMSCLLWEIWRKLTMLQRHDTVHIFTWMSVCHTISFNWIKEHAAWQLWRLWKTDMPFLAHIYMFASHQGGLIFNPLLLIIEIWWKYYHATIQIINEWLWQYFTHGKAFTLWEKFIEIWCPKLSLMQMFVLSLWLRNCQ